MTKTWSEILAIILKTFSFREFFDMVSEQECEILYNTAIRLNCKNILELGTGKGTSTITLLFACKELDAKLTTIDLNQAYITDSRKMKFTKQEDLEKYLITITKDDITVEWNTPIELLFIDTSHNYPHTFNELEKYMPFVTQGGECLLHDALSGCYPANFDQANAAVIKSIFDYLFKIGPRINDFVSGERGPSWNYQVYNTWTGIGRIYQDIMENGRKLLK